MTAIAEPTIPGPDPEPSPPAEALPDGACDTHAHLFGPQSRYPYQANRSYTPPDASADAYRHLLKTLGFQRGVLVQPSVYGTDNSRMLDFLETRADDGMEWRGIAVVDGRVSDAELKRMHDAGVRGIRVNMVFPGGTGFAEVQSLAERIAGLGWHVQFLIDVSSFSQLKERLERLAVPSVVDHMGHMAASKGVQNPGFQALLELMTAGRTWVKLTGPNRISGIGQPPFTDVDPLFTELLTCRPDRCLFGTDWPHVQLPTSMPSDADLVNEFLRLVPSAATRKQVLVDNPAQLYGF